MAPAVGPAAFFDDLESALFPLHVLTLFGSAPQLSESKLLPVNACFAKSPLDTIQYCT